MERDREQGRAGSDCGVSVAEVACLTSPTPHLSSPQLSSGERVSLLARECVLLSRRPEAESIQLQRPPLHLTFHPGDTDIQSNAVKLLAPARLLLSLMSIPRGGFSRMGPGEVGHQRLKPRQWMRVRAGPVGDRALWALWVLMLCLWWDTEWK